MKNILKIRKDEIVGNVGDDGFKKLKKVKLLKLMELEIQQLIKYWSLSQILEIMNSELEFKISKTVFYEFCAKNLEKDKNTKHTIRDKKSYKGVVQDTTSNKKEESILDEDEQNAVAMYGSPSKKSI